MTTGGRYGKQTKVPVSRSQAEIRYILDRYGYGTEGLLFYSEPVTGREVVGFRYNLRSVRIMIIMPEREEFRFTPKGKRRPDDMVGRAHDQAIRQRWRALVLILTAKLEAIDSGVITFEEAFLPFLVLPDNRTVGEALVPQLDDMYLTDQIPAMLMPPPHGPPSGAIALGDGSGSEDVR